MVTTCCKGNSDQIKGEGHFHGECVKAVKQVAQSGCGTSVFRNIHKSAGQGPEQLDLNLVSLVWDRSLDWVTFRSPSNLNYFMLLTAVHCFIF